jgi:carboxypeptidase Q
LSPLPALAVLALAAAAPVPVRRSGPLPAGATPADSALAGAASAPARAAAGSAPPAAVDLAGLSPDARRVLSAALEGGAYDVLAELTDGIGARLAGSEGADAAVGWAAARLRREGLAVRLEPVRVRRWVRGEERAEVLASGAGRAQPLAVTALGNSPPTPPEGLAADVVEVRSLEELRALGDRVRGKGVLFQHDMRDAAGYGRFVRLRTRGPAEAARLGAAAALVRSLSTATLRAPHTGTTLFPPEVRPIPAAGIAVEDAELIHRLLARGPVRVRLWLGCGPGRPPEVDTANVVAELPGGERPGEVVLVGAHLDSWDLGAGAVDDGAGVAMVMEAMRILRAMPRPPRRTVRAVLFMNEENGVDGGIAYARANAADGARTVAALEADGGAGRPLGVRARTGPGGLEIVRGWARALAPLGADGVAEGGGGTDVSPLEWQRVPTLDVRQDPTRYFDWHHSAADTLDKVDRRELAEATAAFAWIAWSAADAAETLPRPPPPPDPPWWEPAPVAETR